MSPKPVGKQAETYEDGFVTSRLRHVRELRVGGDPSLFAMQGTGPRAWNQVVTKHLHFRLCHEIIYTSTLMRDQHRSWEDSVIAGRTPATPQKKESRSWWGQLTKT